MKFFLGAVILVASIVCLVEAYYGNPARLIVYVLFTLFMGGGAWIMNKLKNE